MERQHRLQRIPRPGIAFLTNSYLETDPHADPRRHTVITGADIALPFGEGL